ncbi:MAG: arginine--tRNA ligase, partial [Candidatus Chisholmbacteria bacterium]|nr:arginine--tRNA ligase [Candidatus Chisholmbacteria bacterium]
KYQVLSIKYKNPRKLAEEIVEKINKSDVVDRVEVAGPGFINFFLSEQFLWEEIKRVVDLGERYGSNQLRRGEKIMVEYTDPNPFKEFHIGHLYSNAVGESLCRLLEANGATVRRVNYQGDVGMHVAKALWGLRQSLQSSVFSLQQIGKKSLAERIKILGEAYAAGTKAYEDPSEGGEATKRQIEKINKQVYEHDPEVEELYQKGRAWSLEYFETIYQRLGTKFDGYYFESQAGEMGVKLVRGWLKKGVFKESEGAIIFPGERYGLHTRVFINALGLPTYEAKELGLAPMKYKDWAYDRSVIVTGNEINEYFKVLIAAMKQVEPELGERTRHIGHGMVRLPTGKMSSRKGGVLTGEWLVDEVKGRVNQIISKSDNQLTGDEAGEISEMIAVGAVKYALLKNSVGQDVVFDLDKSVALEGNSGPYLQYTFARTQSVLRKARGIWQVARGQELRATSYELNSEELGILRWLYRFPEVVAAAGERYEPSQICTYLYEIAQRFNTFYNKHSILGGAGDRQKALGTRQEEEIATNDQKTFRLAMTAGVGQVIKNGLGMLGIKCPERM